MQILQKYVHDASCRHICSSFDTISLIFWTYFTNAFYKIPRRWKICFLSKQVTKKKQTPFNNKGVKLRFRNITIILKLINRLLVNKRKHFEKYQFDSSMTIFNEVCFVNWQFLITFLTPMKCLVNFWICEHL